MARAFCHLRGGIPLLLLVALWAAVPSAERGDDPAAVIIQCASSCEQTAAAIRAVGGNVTNRYENIQAIAATVPAERLADLATASARISRDYVASVPRSSHEAGPAGDVGLATSLGEFEATSLTAEHVAQMKDLALNGLNLDATTTGAGVIHAAGNRGEGIIVAVIDSGSANTPVEAPALAGSIIGGESLVPDDPLASATSRLNDPHGTRVASLVAGHGMFVLSNTSAFVRSLRLHAPNSVFACEGTDVPVPQCKIGSSVVPMVGAAPEAKIYAVKVAHRNGAGVPQSRLIAAMDRVLTLRRNFNAGMPSVPVAGDGSENNPFVFNSLKIDVVNMSIGGPTLFAGKSEGERLTLQMVQAGIIVIATAGNNGPAAMTLGNPGSGRGALAVGATSSFIHDRILRDVQFGVGLGVLLRPFAANQTAWFSSRGPTADGRVLPDMVANGMGVFAPAFNRLDLVSGTSYAAPTVSGAAALLRKHAPWATALQIRNALMESASVGAIGDGSSDIDRGRGALDVAAARALLDSAAVSEVLARGLGDERVSANIKSVGRSPISFLGGVYTDRVEGLLPSQVEHVFVPITVDTRSVRIRVTEIVSESPGEQNQVFGTDSVLVHVVDAPTSLARAHVAPETFVNVGAEFTVVVTDPQPGVMRIALAGASSNGAPVSATFTIERLRNEVSGKDTADSEIRQGQVIPVRLDVPAGTQTLRFDLSWDSDWGHYPTSDLDVVLTNPLGETMSVATIDSPERFTIQTPIPGRWTIAIHGFAVGPLGSSDDEDKFELRVFADGRLLRERD